MGQLFNLPTGYRLKETRQIIRLQELLEQSIVQRNNKQAQFFTEDLGNNIKLEMVAIPAGTFMMGSAEGEGNDNERPQDKVIV